jgi:hypothetical protein
MFQVLVTLLRRKSTGQLSIPENLAMSSDHGTVRSLETKKDGSNDFLGRGATHAG